VQNEGVVARREKLKCFQLRAGWWTCKGE